MPTTNEFLPQGAVREPIEKAAGEALDYPATEVGSVGNISVYYATSLGVPGKNLADGLLKVVWARTTTWRVILVSPEER